MPTSSRPLRIRHGSRNLAIVLALLLTGLVSVGGCSAFFEDYQVTPALPSDQSRGPAAGSVEVPAA